MFMETFDFFIDYNRLRDRNLDLSLVREFPDKDWSFYSLSGREDLDMNLVKELINKDWNFNYIHKFDINYIYDLIEKMI